MRVVQIIDSLDAGGAERMAVSIANALAEKNYFSSIIATRNEGYLKQSINKNVLFLFLNKKRIIDVKAIFKIVNFVYLNKITIIHAHSTSFFLAVIVKLFKFNVKIIWHDHYGKSDFLYLRKSLILKFCSYFFYSIISVSRNLKKWSLENLKCRLVYYIPNFAVLDKINQMNLTKLKGNSGKRIICLANLRPQKNHLFLIKIAQRTIINNPDWSFHLVGKDFNDQYSCVLKNEIKKINLHNNIYIYGSKSDIYNILQQSSIGILTSESEAFPVSVLEYGLAKIPVITTDVGSIKEIIKHNINGFLIKNNDLESFVLYLQKLINSKCLRENMGKENYEYINNNFSKEITIDRILNVYKSE